MNLETQVVSLELAKKLKNLGVKQESLAYFICQEVGDNYDLHIFDNGESVKKSFEMNKREIISAFTVAELGEILPQIIKIKSIKYQLFCSIGLDKQWFVVYVNEEDYHDNAPIKIIMCHNEADARAKMLIYLIENNLIKK